MNSLTPVHVPGDAPSIVGIADRVRPRAIMVQSGSGTGKTFLLARMAVQQLLRGIPTVVWDPLGPLSDAIINNLLSLPEADRDRFARRLWYLDLSGRAGSGVVLPLLYRLGTESWYEIADRPLTTFIKLDPYLSSAPILGENALTRVGVPVGMVLAALGNQLDQAPSLLGNPEQWQRRLENLASACPEVAPAVDFFRAEYFPLKPADRAMRSATFLAKVADLALNPALRAMFCGASSSLDFDRLLAERAVVICDFRGEINPGLRRLKSRWIFDCLMTWVKLRGPHRSLPLSLIVDELTDLTNQRGGDESLFAADLDELINVYGRNYNIWTVLALQEQFQVSDRIRNTLATAGTQIVGGSSSLAGCELLARQLVGINVWRVKRLHNVWAHSRFGSEIIEQEPIYMPPDEQVALIARKIMTLPSFEYLVGGREWPAVTRIRAFVGAPPWPSERIGEIAAFRAQLSGPKGLTQAAHLMPSNGSTPHGTLKDVAHEDTEETTYPGLEGVSRDRRGATAPNQ